MLRPRTIASSLPYATSRGRYFIPQSGATTMRLARRVSQRGADPIRHDLGCFDGAIAQIEHAYVNTLGRQ